MYVREWNTTGTKTAVLVHGLSSSSYTWARLAHDLAALDYHVYAPDMPGHGKTGSADDYTVDDWSKALLSLNITQPDLLIGHSMGGLVIANTFEQIQPKQIILVDPMFNFPRVNSVAFLTRAIYQTHLQVAGKVNRLVPAVYGRVWAERDVKLAINNLKRWDAKSSKLLQYRPDIIKKFFRKAGDTLLLRTKHSFLVPAHWEQKVTNPNITFQTFDTQHNIHVEAYKDFWETVQKFVTKNT